jgi:hypothetical protein
MTEERLSRKNVALSRINEILAKIDEVCDDARMAGVEKVRRIKERGCERPRAAKGAKRKLRVARAISQWTSARPSGRPSSSQILYARARMRCSRSRLFLPVTREGTVLWYLG